MGRSKQHKSMRRATLQKHNGFELRAFMSVSLESNLSSLQRFDIVEDHRRRSARVLQTGLTINGEKTLRQRNSTTGRV